MRGTIDEIMAALEAGLRADVAGGTLGLSGLRRGTVQDGDDPAVPAVWVDYGREPGTRLEVRWLIDVHGLPYLLGLLYVNGREFSRVHFTPPRRVDDDGLRWEVNVLGLRVRLLGMLGAFVQTEQRLAGERRAEATRAAVRQAAAPAGDDGDDRFRAALLGAIRGRLGGL